jgi:hypothetical protein
VLHRNSPSHERGRAVGPHVPLVPESFEESKIKGKVRVMIERFKGKGLVKAKRSSGSGSWAFDVRSPSSLR